VCALRQFAAYRIGEQLGWDRERLIPILSFLTF